MIDMDDYRSFLSFRPLDFVMEYSRQASGSYNDLRREDMIDLPYKREKDGKVSIRLYYPKAKNVVMMFQRKPVPMIKEGDYFTFSADWKDGIYPIALIVDGNMVIDPMLPIGYGHNQPFNYINLVDRNSVFAVKDVPHGSVQSFLLKNSVTGKEDRIFVYIPAGYGDNNCEYDVLFLQHGFGENETAWLSEGRIDNICDNLIAEGDITPLLIVMANGMLYEEEDGIIHMMHHRFGEYLKNDIIPFIEKQYRCMDHYMAGLSMGSIQTSITALEDPELFKGVGLFSGFLSDPISGYRDHLTPEKIHSLLNNAFLMRGIGDSDRFLPVFEKEDQLMGSFEHFRKIYHGEHEWNVWREMIVDFLLLREEKKHG